MRRRPPRGRGPAGLKIHSSWSCSSRPGSTEYRGAGPSYFGTPCHGGIRCPACTWRKGLGSRRRTVVMSDDRDVGLPLVGLRVVDTTDSPSWSSARLLADLGADVIRVERTPQPLDALSAT